MPDVMIGFPDRCFLSEAKAGSIEISLFRAHFRPFRVF